MNIPFSLSFALLFLALAAPAAAPELLYSLHPLPEAAVTDLGSGIKEPDRIVSPQIGDLSVGAVEKFHFRIDFPEPVRLPRLAIPRVGWGDWALPKTVEYKVNGGPARTLELRAARIAPNGKAPSVPADLLILGSDPVKSLEFKVVSVETRVNRHGAIKLAVPGRAVLSCPLGEEWTDSAGAAIEITVPAEVEGAELAATAYRFRSDIVWTRPLPKLAAGVNRVELLWSEFSCPEEPQTPLAPENLHLLELSFPHPPAGGVSLKCAPLPARRAAGFAERFPMPDFSAGPDGWRNGIPADGFGRFGYHAGNGLLTVNLENDAFYYQTSDGAHLKLAVGNGGAQRTAWRRVDVGSDHMVITQLKRFPGAKENKVASRAFGEFDASRLPERYVASILAPGFLIHSQDAVLTLKPESDLGTPYLLFPGRNGAMVWSKAAEADLTALSEGWAVVSFEKRPELPVLLAFEEKPQKAVADGGTLGFLFGRPRGWVGFGTPAGYRPFTGKPGAGDAETRRLATVSRRLASLLRCYPLQSEMKFRVDGDRVDFAESFRHLAWSNAWGESGEPFLPCPPLAAFGADEGYPVTFPAGEPEPFGLDTKYGPYRVWRLSELKRGRYALPLPPADNTLYPRPAGNAEAARVAEAVARHIGGEPKPRGKGDSLSCWWMYASGSLAQSLFTPEQRDAIAAAWKHDVGFVLGPRPWYARTEPFSSRRYPVSFAWTDRANEILGDPNSGIGGALSGLANYARFTGDWRTIDENWETIRRFPLFFYLSHDWTMMQSGCREHTAASAIDMDVISYEGVAGLLRMAKTLGKGDDEAAAAMLLARYALADTQKWKAPGYRRPAVPREEYRSIGIGFSEHFGFEVMSARGGNPNHINSEIALSLAWIGSYPCFYAMLLAGNGEEFWRFFEYTYVEQKLDNWRKRHPGHRNWHDANIAPHLYLRLLLGEKPETVRRELEAQKMLAPDPRMAAENAGFYALYFGGASPVRLSDQGRAKLLRFDWDEAARTVEAEFESAEPFTPAFELTAKPRSGPGSGQVLPPGRHTLRWTF